MTMDLRSQCHTILPGQKNTSPAELFQQMADWCTANNTAHDTYGEGQLIQDIAQGFNSVYVSLYKGINGLGGSILLGDKDYIEKARYWMMRQGGNVYHRTPYIVSAAMQFDNHLEKIAAYYERTQQIYHLLKRIQTYALTPKNHTLI